MWCTHFASNSCIAVHLYFNPATVPFRPVDTAALYNSSFASASLASVYVQNFAVQLYTQFGLPGLWYYTAEPVYRYEVNLIYREDQSQCIMDSSALLWLVH